MDCVVQTHKHSKGAVTCPDPELICHHGDAELVESYQSARFHQGWRDAKRGGGWEPGLYLEEGSFGWVQLSVALHLGLRKRAHLLTAISQWLLAITDASRQKLSSAVDLLLSLSGEYPCRGEKNHPDSPQRPQQESCPQPPADKDTWMGEPHQDT